MSVDPMKSLNLFILLAFLISCKAQDDGNSQAIISESYHKSRAEFKSKIIRKVKAPQAYSDFVDQRGDIKLVSYESEGMQLKGLLHTQNIDTTKKNKAVVYLHGGFALGYGDLNDCQPFIDSGYVVFAPSYRGENGNPGNFELFYGEVTDAENAVNWLASQDYIDENNVYVFGHSIGGAMSLLLSLNDNSRSRLNGSSAGLYFAKSFQGLIGEENIPFDETILAEYDFRFPLYNLIALRKSHYLYIGSEDDFRTYSLVLKSYYNEIPENLELIEIGGDHFSSLKPAMIEFIKTVEKEFMN